MRRNTSGPAIALSPCTETELRQLVAHLRTDLNAEWVANGIGDGSLRVFQARVTSRESLGALSTAFGVLGRDPAAMHAPIRTGRDRFLVSEALAFWRQSRGDDASLEKLERYITDERLGQLVNRTVTLFEDATGLRIVDGNKRAIAIYEACFDNQEVVLPVFVATRPPNRPSLRGRVRR